MLRTEAGRNPYDRGLSDLIGELSTRSETFRNRWATHNVRLHRAGAKQFHHPVVGDLRLTYEVMGTRRPTPQIDEIPSGAEQTNRKDHWSAGAGRRPPALPEINPSTRWGDGGLLFRQSRTIPRVARRNPHAALVDAVTANAARGIWSAIAGR
jgi:hypothetical protein